MTKQIKDPQCFNQHMSYLLPMGNHMSGWMILYHLTPIPLPNETENNFINTGESEAVMKRLCTQVSTSFYNS